eukprot:scaffold24937_cov140-Isochrysis_galbana.AAC.1
MDPWPGSRGGAAPAGRRWSPTNELKKIVQPGNWKLGNSLAPQGSRAKTTATDRPLRVRACDRRPEPSARHHAPSRRASPPDCQLFWWSGADG